MAKTPTIKLVKLVDELNQTTGKELASWRELADLVTAGWQSTLALYKLIHRMQTALKNGKEKQFKILWDEYQLEFAKHKKLLKQP